jgi:hypothetical protein
VEFQIERTNASTDIPDDDCRHVRGAEAGYALFSKVLSGFAPS